MSKRNRVESPSLGFGWLDRDGEELTFTSDSGFVVRLTWNSLSSGSPRYMRDLDIAEAKNEALDEVEHDDDDKDFLNEVIHDSPDMGKWLSVLTDKYEVFGFKILD